MSRVDTRFDAWPRWTAVALLAATMALVAIGFGADRPALPYDPATLKSTDTGLYLAVAADVRRGENYYDAAVREHRKVGYPLHPFVTVREPTLAWITAAVGGLTGLKILMAPLLVAIAVLGAHRLDQLGIARWQWWIAALLWGAGFAAMCLTSLPARHETWAGALIALGLLLYRRDRVIPSAGLILASVLIRDLALLAPAILGLMALFGRRWRELTVWAVVGGIGAAALAMHAAAVSHHVTAADRHSQGWTRCGGWPFSLTTIDSTSLLLLVQPIAPLVVPLALLGWLSIRAPLANQIVALAVGYLAVFACVGRPENWYWGFLISAMLVPGISFAGPAVASLVRRAFRTDLRA
ncbi:MAG: hypothetical protein ACJ71Z_10420 [Aeromicrobium sp.]